MPEPTDLIVPMLREMRRENATLHEQTRAMLAALDARMGDMDVRQKSFRQALSADSLLSKLVTGDFEERLEALELKIKTLELQK